MPEWFDETPDQPPTRGEATGKIGVVSIYFFRQVNKGSTANQGVFVFRCRALNSSYRRRPVVINAAIAAHRQTNPDIEDDSDRRQHASDDEKIPVIVAGQVHDPAETWD